MKGKQYRLSKLKNQLQERKEYGTKVLYWSLKEDQAEYIRNFYLVEPYLFTIKTKRIPKQIRMKSSLLKQIHYKNGQGKKYITLKLKPKDVSVLIENGIGYRIAKYTIYLQKQHA